MVSRVLPARDSHSGRQRIAQTTRSSASQRREVLRDRDTAGTAQRCEVARACLRCHRRALAIQELAQDICSVAPGHGSASAAGQHVRDGFARHAGRLATDVRDESVEANSGKAAGESQEERKPRPVASLHTPAAAIQSRSLSSRGHSRQPNGVSWVRIPYPPHGFGLWSASDAVERRRRGACSRTQPERNAAAEPQTEATRACGQCPSPACDERAWSWSGAGAVEREQGRPEARAAKRRARWSRRHKT